MPSQSNIGNKKQELVQAVAFVFEECTRLQRLLEEGIRTKDGIKRIPREDAFHTIPHPTGGGSILCGRAAAMKLEKLAEEAGRRSGLSRRVERDTLLRPLGELIVQRFLREKRPLDVTQVERVLSAVGKQARASCTDIEHLVPCHLMHAKDPAELRVGPVVFRNRSVFRRFILDKLQAKNSHENKRKRNRWVLARALKYYRNFNWVAQVTVKCCDPKTSARIAERAVTSALDCLHLVLGAQSTYKMRVAGPAVRTDRRGSLTISADGRLRSSASVAWAGQVNFEAGWSKCLDRPEYQRLLELCGVALEAAVDPDLERPLSHRFLDAAQWFGEASRDDSPSTSVVKYVTALERMVMTEEKNDIAKLVSERVAAICFDPHANDRDAWREKARTAYDLRSKLVHGAMSPRAPEVWRGLGIGAELGEATLLHTLSHFGEAGLRMETISPRKLGQWFNQVIDWADKTPKPV
ncbi:MAG TPA: hypothetical protein VF601_20465 [Beijerinckiaceae bacterium]|jgi:hypothetical protein